LIETRTECASGTGDDDGGDGRVGLGALLADPASILAEMNGGKE